MPTAVLAPHHVRAGPARRVWGHAVQRLHAVEVRRVVVEALAGATELRRHRPRRRDVIDLCPEPVFLVLFAELGKRLPHAMHS